MELGTQVGIPSHASGFGACNTRRSSGGEGSEDGGGRKSWGEAVNAYNFESGLSNMYESFQHWNWSASHTSHGKLVQFRDVIGDARPALEPLGLAAQPRRRLDAS